MAIVYDETRRQLMSGALSLLNDDLRVLLVMSDSTAGISDNVQTVSQIFTLDEYDGAGYQRQVIPVSGRSIIIDSFLPGDPAAFDSDPVVFPALGLGTRPAIGALLYKHIGTDAQNILIAFLDDPEDFPFDGNDEDLTISWGRPGAIALYP